MHLQPNPSVLQAARAWAQTANVAQIESAHRLLRVATTNSQPAVMLRLLFRSATPCAHAALVESFFDGAPTRPAVDAFLREVTDERPAVTHGRRLVRMAV